MFRCFLGSMFVLSLLSVPVSAQPKADPKGIFPPGPLDALDRKNIPEEKLIPYAPSEAVGELATPMGEFRRVKYGMEMLHEGVFHGLAFSPDGTKLAASVRLRRDKGGDLQQHWVWDLAKPLDKPKVWDEPVKYSGEFRHLLYNTEGDLVEWNAGHGGSHQQSESSLSRWPAKEAEPIRSIIEFPAALKAKVPGTGGPYDWNVEDRKTYWAGMWVRAGGKRVIREGNYWGPKAVFSGEGSQQRPETHRIAVWDVTVDPPKLVGDLMRHWLSSHYMAMTPDGKLLATNDLDMKEYKDPNIVTAHTRLYDANTIPMRLLSTVTHKSVGLNSRQLPASTLVEDPYSMAFTPDGTRLYTIAQDVKDYSADPWVKISSVWVWDCRGRSLVPVKGFPVTGPSGNLMFTPDGTKLLRVYHGRAKYDDSPYQPPTLVVTPIISGLPNFAAEQVIKLSFAASVANEGFIISEFAVAPDSRHMAIATEHGKVIVLRLPTFGKKK